uniref:Uncharacterized protein n=1 Tax=Salix viminalis TaxID=40686 RepID=A0A6N2L703_SALVM
MRGATRGLPRRSPILVLLSPKHRGEGRRSSPDFAGVSGGRFPCSSYGIATVTAGSLEFQDFIPGPWLRQFSEFWDEISGGLRRRGRGQTSVRVE